MDGHLYVVGRISTPSWGKPGAARYYGDPPWGHRAETRVSTILHCHGILDSVANKNEAANNDKKNQKTKNQTTRNQKTKNQENKKQENKNLQAYPHGACACRKRIQSLFSPATGWGRAPESGADPTYSLVKYIRLYAWKEIKPFTQGHHT